jgi:hypothetical protein
MATQNWTSYGYFPEPTKSILIVPAHSLDTVRAAFIDFKFTVVMGSRYIGGFIGERTAFNNGWIWKKTKS